MEIESTEPTTVQDRPEPIATSPGALSVDVLRRKLDAAIMAEAWDAVKAIRERIREAERADVVDLDRERERRP